MYLTFNVFNPYFWSDVTVKPRPLKAFADSKPQTVVLLLS